MTAAHLLVIAGEAEARATLERELADEGFTVASAPDGDSGLDALSRNDIDLVLLDTGFRKTEVEILGRLRDVAPRLPIFVLSNVDETGPMIIGLDSGADDYISKPVSARRLAARIRARLRRDDTETSLTRGPLTLDVISNRADVDGRTVELSAREVELLATLMRHDGNLLSRDELLEKVWNVDFDPGSNVVSVYVRALRKKIGEEFIETERGRGYRFVVPGEKVGARG